MPDVDLKGFEAEEVHEEQKPETYYYSPSTGGFYLLSFHGAAIPGDAVKITPDLHTALIEGQSNGKVITPPDTDHALPYLADPPAPTVDELARAVRAERDRLLAETDYLAMPDYPLGEKVRAAVTTYRQALRDVPKQAGFPQTIKWPERPEVG